MLVFGAYSLLFAVAAATWLYHRLTIRRGRAG